MHSREGNYRVLASDIAKHPFVLNCNKADDHALATETTATADTVCVALVVGGRV